MAPNEEGGAKAAGLLTSSFPSFCSAAALLTYAFTLLGWSFMASEASRKASCSRPLLRFAIDLLQKSLLVGMWRMPLVYRACATS